MIEISSGNKTVFPEEWDIVRLGEIGEFFKGKGISKSELEGQGEHPCVRYGEIYTIYDTYINSFQSYINQQSSENSVRFYSGDLLFTGSGETVEDIGKCVTYTGNEKPFASGDIIIHRPVIGDSLYLSYCMNSSLIRNQTKKLGQGNAVVHIYSKHLSQLTFPLPPLPEQQKIAEILSTVDEKIDVIDQQISETQVLKKGLMQRLLSKGIGHSQFKDSPLGEIPESWEVIEIGDAGKLKGGYAFSSSDTSIEGIRWMKIANVGINEIKWDEKSFLPSGFEIKHSDFVLNEGDIIIAMTRPILGDELKIARVSIDDSGSLLNQRVGRVEVNKNLLKDFAYQVFNSTSLINAMKKELLGTDPPNISSSMFESLKIPLPPLSEQQKIADILSSVDEKLDVLSEKKGLNRELKKGLMQQLLTGKIRVNGLIEKN